MQTFEENSRRWRRGRKVDPLLMVRSRDSCHRSSPDGHGGAMLRMLRLLDVSLGHLDGNFCEYQTYLMRFLSLRRREWVVL